MTVDEFLAWEDGTDTRYELVDGVAIAMAPPAERAPHHRRQRGSRAQRPPAPPSSCHAEAVVPDPDFRPGLMAG